MKEHYIHIKQKGWKDHDTFTGRTFTRAEVREILNYIRKFTDGVIYDEVNVTFICNSIKDADNIMDYLYELL